MARRDLERLPFCEARRRFALCPPSQGTLQPADVGVPRLHRRGARGGIQDSVCSAWFCQSRQPQGLMPQTQKTDTPWHPDSIPSAAAQPSTVPTSVAHDARRWCHCVCQVAARHASRRAAPIRDRQCELEHKSLQQRASLDGAVSRRRVAFREHRRCIAAGKRLRCASAERDPSARSPFRRLVILGSVPQSAAAFHPRQPVLSRSSIPDAAGSRLSALKQHLTAEPDRLQCAIVDALQDNLVNGGDRASQISAAKR